MSRLILCQVTLTKARSAPPCPHACIPAHPFFCAVRERLRAQLEVVDQLLAAANASRGAVSGHRLNADHQIAAHPVRPARTGHDLHTWRSFGGQK